MKYIILLLLITTSYVSSQFKEWKSYKTSHVGAAVAKGDYVYSTCSGLSITNIHTDESIHIDKMDYPACDVRLTCVEVDLSGNVLIGSGNEGIHMYDGNSWTHFNYANTGISMQYGDEISVDSSNNIWYTSRMYGTFRYDGNIWEMVDFGMNSTFEDIEIDSEGKIWFISNYGLSFLSDGIMEIVEHPDIGNFPPQFNSFSNMIIDKNNRIWLSYREHIFSYKAGEWKQYEPDIPNTFFSYIIDITVDDANNKYFLRTKTVLAYDNEFWTLITPFLKKGPIGYASRISADKNQKLWITSQYGLIKLDKNTWKGETLNVNDASFDAYSLKNLETDKEGVLYGVGAGRVFRFVNSNWELVPEIKEFQDCDNIYVDSKNNKWISTSGAGLIKYKDGNCEYFREDNSDLNRNNVGECIEDDNGVLWVLTDKLFTYDGSVWSEIPVIVDLPDFRGFWSITIDGNGDKWFTTSGGAVRYDGAEFRLYTDLNSGLISSEVNVVDVDNFGNLWFGSSNAVVSYDGFNWNSYFSSDYDNGFSRVSGFTFDKYNNVYVVGRGTCRIQDGDVHIISTQNSGLMFDEVTDISVDSTGNVWFATARGVSVFKPGNEVIADVDDDYAVDNYVVATNYPNPFNPVTTISYNLPEAGIAEVVVYDFLGQEIETLQKGYQYAGSHELKFIGSEYASGVYFYKISYELKGKMQSVTKKMILMK